MNHRYSQFVRGWSILLLVALALVGQAAHGQSIIKPSYVPNQLIVRMASGTSEADRDKAIEQLGATLVKPIALTNTYLVELLPTRGLTIESAVTRAGAIPGITDASPNYYAYPQATPNDPRWSQLWGMRMINAPNAWDYEKGDPTVIVAVNDTGVSPTHPDLQGRLLPGRDTADGDDDPSPSPTDPNSSHGTHVAGTIAAQGDNNEGVVGVCWNGVKILPVKIFPNVGGGAPLSAIIDGLDFARRQGARVVNMSYGGPFASQFEREKLKELAAAGIILVAAAGNNAGPVLYPAAFEECVAVSAVNMNEQPTYYTCFGPEIDIAAPGGEGPTDDPGTIWSTTWFPATGNGYGGFQGTSMAAPHVSGAAALLLSDGVPANKVVERLLRSARAPRSGALDPTKYGNGILDLENAVSSQAEVDIIAPTNGEILDSTTPVFKIETYMVRKESIKVFLDYTDDNKDGVPDDLTKDIILNGVDIDSLASMYPDRIEYDGVTGALTFKWPLTTDQMALLPGTHTVAVTGEPTAEARPGMASDWNVFFIEPRVLTSGRHMFSIPYPLSSTVTPYDLFGSRSFRLARYVPSLDGYAKINFPGEADNPDAWPASPGVRPHGDTVDTPPAGLGFWLNLPGDTPIVVEGIADKTRAYDITLTRGSTGWNMIGNPFPFPVPWESVKVTYQGKTLMLKDAVALGWIRPALYRYTSSGFTFQTPPEAVLVPWEGHWVRILPDKTDRQNDTMVLIVPPVESGAVIETPKSRAAASGENWSLRLAASAGSAADAHNILGVNSRAADGYDLMDVEAPPVIDGYVQLSFTHRDWGTSSGRYTTDFRQSVGSGKAWEFDVVTDMPSQDVTVTWPDIASVPKKYSLVLEDVDSGSRVYMRTRSGYTYNSGATPGPRHFKLRVESADAGRLMVSNVVVSPTKGSTISISYAVSRDARVEVRLRDSGNRLVRALGGNVTRAAGLNSVYWDSTFEDGRKAASGLYLVEIVATSLDGEVAKTVRPILVR
ncbi:MAG: S8 family serine peptidase [Armatimonadetes bacterium]|nr:S8 family serine peptidase [Armatimonadota bacterium]